MKKINFKLLIAIILSSVTVFQSCKKDEVISEKQGQVLLSFSVTNSQLKSAVIDTSYTESTNTSAEASAIVVSIDDLKGNSLFSAEKMQLLKFGEDYVTKALTLKPGSYVVTEYYVVDELDNVIYSAPKSGSVVAKWVNEPLPINFDVKKDAVTKLAPEVVSTLNASPEDFGYTTFRLNAINTFDFLISVFAYDKESKSFDLVSSKLKVSAQGKELVTKDLSALTDSVTLPDNYDSYVLSVEKEGYKTFTDTVSNNELKKYFSSEEYGPLKIYLEKSDKEVVTLITNQTELKEVIVYTDVVIDSISSKTVSIDWGDGSDYEVLEFGYSKVSHSYMKSGLYQIKLFGEVKNIVVLKVQDANVEEVDLSSANQLGQLMLDSNKLSKIDLSSLNKLSFLYLSNNKISEIQLDKNVSLRTLWMPNNELKQIDLTNNSEIRNLTISNNPISTLTISNLIYLEDLFVSGCNLTHLDVSKNVKLKSLRCDSEFTNLNNLNVTNNKELQTLTIRNQKKILHIDLSNNVKLKNLDLWDTAIDSIDISYNKQLKSLWVRGCNMESLNIKENSKLIYLDLTKNKFNQDYFNDFYIALLSNVSTTNTRGGYLFTDPIDPTLPEAIQAKNDLVNKFGWKIYKK